MKRSILVAAVLVAAASANAQLAVRNAWVRATVAGQKTTGAFMEIMSATNARLVGVRTPVAGLAEVHEMGVQDDVMHMGALPALPLPAGKPVALGPGGYHVMLMDLKRDIKASDTVPLTLLVEDANGRHRIDIVARALALDSMPPEHHHH